MQPVHPIVRDVMTKDVVTVQPDTPFKRIAELLADHAISAVPVVDRDGCPVGVVSEADLLYKQEYPPGAGTAPLRERLLHQAAMAKVGAGVARELMTRLPVSIGPDAGLAVAARRLLHERVKRLLVLDEDGRLIGIVSRGDLLRSFLRSDEAIRIEIHEGVIARELCLDPLRFHVRVCDGNVTLTGQVDRRDQIPLVLERVGAVEGIVSLDTRLTAADDGWGGNARFPHVMFEKW